MGGVYINITESPSLTELVVQDATGLHGLVLRGVPYLSWSNHHTASVVILESNTCLDLPALESVRNLHLTGTDIVTCDVLVKLTSVLNLTLTGSDTLEAGPVASVGGNAFITSNANVHIDIDNLHSVKGNLSINNNQNCTFTLDHLVEVGSLLVIDNPNTRLPSFPSLLRAKNIHLREYIGDSNIFPALVRVSDTVTIEPWNDDFDCTKLISQQQEGSINNLSCNGNDDGNLGTVGVPIGNGLTQGAEVSIGIGVTVSILAATIAIVWLLLRFNIQRKRLSQESAMPLLFESRDITDTVQESGGQGTIQEIPGDPAHEAEGQMPMHEVEGQMIL
ncbi:hypothetical protein F4859DRAFT_529557 [Xylaria cf. heliscus]|nr:hypothetical protein F4859DRAFT_529557 [Xylaria cf. heliscus]